MSGRTPVGILGGTFDPVHLGHLQVAHAALKRLSLSRVVLMLSAHPPHKDPGELSPARHRLAMLQAAVEDWPGLEVGTLEHARKEVSYTIDTLRALRKGTPVVDPIFILGMDALIEIPTWRDYQELLAEFDLLVVDRSDRAQAPEQLEPAIRERLVRVDDLAPEPGRGGRIFRLPLQPIPISSSEVRLRTAAGRPLDELVTGPVAKYILAHRLYIEEKSPRQP